MTTETTAPHGFDDDHEDFRNELASVLKDGRRKWVYARKPSGRFYAARTYISYVLLASFLIFNLFIGIVLNAMEENIRIERIAENGVERNCKLRPDRWLTPTSREDAGSRNSHT